MNFCKLSVKHSDVLYSSTRSRKSDESDAEQSNDSLRAVAEAGPINV